MLATDFEGIVANLTAFLLILQLCCIEAIKLQPVEAGVETRLCQQLLMRPAFHNAPAFQDQDAIRIFNGGEAVGDDKGGTSVPQRVKRLLYLALRLGVECRGGLVENE